MKQTATENLLYNLFIPPADYLNTLHINELIEADKKIKTQKTLLLEKSQHLEETEKKLRFITSISLCLSSSLVYEKLITSLFKELAQETEIDILSVNINNNQVTTRSIVSSKRFSYLAKRDLTEKTLNNFAKFSETTTSQINSKADFMYLPLPEDKADQKHFIKILPESLYSIPGTLKVGGEIIGLVILHKFNQNFSKFQTDLFFSVLDQIALTLANSMKYKKLRRLASRDGLTGLLNRRVFDEILKREYKRSVRYSSSLSVVFIDIDHFKKINDSFGHQVGDNVLKRFSLLIQKCIRETDILARYGGEEFVLLLPETSRELAIKTAERIRIKLEKYIFLNNKIQFQVTASMGVSSLESHRYTKQTPEEVLHIADGALYEAKNRGRNQVVSAE